MPSKEKERVVEKVNNVNETEIPGRSKFVDNTLLIDQSIDNDLNNYLDNSIFEEYSNN